VDRIQQAHRDLHLAVKDPAEISACPTSPDESVFVDTGIDLDLPAGESQKPRLPKRSQILALIRAHVAQRTEGQECPGERAEPGADRHTGFPANRQGDEGDVRISDPAGKDGSS